MPQNVFARSRAFNAVFKNERYLYPEFVPDKLEHRDAQIDTLVYALNPILQGRKPHNVFIHGPTGTGKTACARFVINSLEEHSDRGKGLYINCFEFDSRSAVLSQIANFLRAAVPRRGVAADEVYDRLLSVLEHAAFIPIIILDEADQLLRKPDGSKLLYDLLRVVEYKTLRFGIVLISNDSGFTAKLDPRVKSSLAEELIEFPQYTPQQLKDILRARAEQAFTPCALGKDVLNVAAAHAAKNGGDARIAIEALWRAGREAEREGTREVTLEHLRKVFVQIEPAATAKALPVLSAEEKLLLKLIAENAPVQSGKLYALYSKASNKPLTERSVRSFVSGLEGRKLISAEEKRLSNKGKTREIKLAVPKESLLKELG